MEPYDLTQHLPLTETTYFILLSLAPGPLHGYAIIKEVQDISHGRVVLAAGTLYGAVKRLLDLGWIRRTGSDEPEIGGRERKLYELTAIGRRILTAETERLAALLAAAQRRLPGEVA